MKHLIKSEILNFKFKIEGFNQAISVTKRLISELEGEGHIDGSGNSSRSLLNQSLKELKKEKQNFLNKNI